MLTTPNWTDGYKIRTVGVKILATKNIRIKLNDPKRRKFFVYFSVKFHLQYSNKHFFLSLIDIISQIIYVGVGNIFSTSI